MFSRKRHFYEKKTFYEEDKEKAKNGDEVSEKKTPHLAVEAANDGKKKKQECVKTQD